MAFEASRSAACRVVMARPDGTVLQPPRLSESRVIVQLEVDVPFVDPTERVVLVGETRTRRFWQAGEGIPMADGEVPLFKTAIEVGPSLSLRIPQTPPCAGRCFKPLPPVPRTA